MDWLDLLQWPAMGVTVAAAALTGSLRPGRRKAGFWLSMIVFSILVTFYVIRVMVDLFIAQRFMLAWRAWLTDIL